MNKIHFFLALFLFAGLISCEDDDSITDPGPDLTNAVNIMAPAEQDSFMLIESFSVDAQIEPSLVLRRLMVYVTDPDGVRSIADLRTITYDNPNILEHTLSISPYKGMKSGMYTLTVEAIDINQKAYRDSISIKFHNPTLRQSDFLKAFNHVSVFTAADWYGYNLKDGYDQVMFSFSFFGVADTDFNIAVSENEWQSFSTDFRLSAQPFYLFDKDNNARLDDVEFEKAMLAQGVFKAWDLNKDEMIYEAEMARGIFNSWDQNQDRMLKDTEYYDKFYTYLRH